MATRCASCGSRLKMLGGRSYWCPECDSFACGRCRHDEKCPVCRTTVEGKSPDAIIFALSMVAVLIGGIIGFSAAEDYIAEYNLATMPVTAAGSAMNGHFVKLEGALVSNSTIAIDSRYNETHDHFRFVRNPVVLRDPRDGQCITLELKEDTIIFPGHHPSGSGEKGETSYYSNDTVIALGTVFVNQTGGKWLRTEKLGPPDAPLYGKDHMWEFVLAILLPAIGLTGGAAAWGWYGRRNERSIASRGGAFKITPIDNYSAPQEVEAIPNARIRFFLKYGILSLVFFLAVFCPVIYFYVEDPGLLLFQNPFLFLMSIVILILFTVTISLFGFSYGYLYELALDDTGLTARYRNGNRIGYRWTDILELKRPAKKTGNTPDSEEAIVLELSNGQEDSFSTLTTRIAEAAETAYNKHKPREESKGNDMMIALLRKKLESTEDREKRALIQQLLDSEDRPGSDESHPEAETPAEPLPGSPPAEGGVSREKGTERPSPGLDLPAPKIIANEVPSAEGPAFRFVALIMGILAFVLVMIFRNGTGNPVSEGAAIIVVMMLGIFLAVGLRLGIFVAFHYYKVAVSVRLFNEGFSVAYRRGGPKEFRWSGIASILSSTDIDPVRNPGKVHSIIVTRLNGEDVRLDGLSKDVAEGLGNLFNSMKPNISRIVLRAKYRGATEDEAQKLFLDLVVDGKEAYDRMPEKWR